MSLPLKCVIVYCRVGDGNGGFNGCVGLCVGVGVIVGVGERVQDFGFEVRADFWQLFDPSE